MSKYLKRTILYCALTLILGFVLGLLCDIIRNPRGDPQTIVLTDTIVKYAPIAVSETIVREVAVRVPVVRTQTREVYIPLDPKIADHPPDSADVVIPITQRQYSDSDYVAWVSGYDPSLDSIRIHRKTVRTPTYKPSRLHLSIGVGATYNGRVTPGIFLGVGYSFCEIKL